MSNDRDKTTADRSVSTTYRQLANERTPADLDEKVLRMAAAEPRVVQRTRRAWMKPVAWAATVGLSLAIVLEITKLPRAPLDGDGVMPPAPTEERPALAVPSAEPAPTEDRPAVAPASIEPATASERRKTKPPRHRLESDGIAESGAQPIAPAQAAAPEPARPSVLESTDVQSLDDLDVAPDARSDKASDSAAFAVRAERMLFEQQPLCPEKVREVAEDWYRCIETQRSTAPAAHVAEELEEFRRKFPDFQAPDPE